MILSQECSLLAEMPKPDEKLLQAPDYSRYAHSFNSYAYSGPSNGTYKIDGETFDVGKNFMTYERYVEYKQAGFTHYFAQHTGVRINKDFCAERWEQEKVKMDAAYCAGLPTILTDQRLLNLSKTERSLFKQNEQDVDYKFEKNKSYAIVGTSGSGKTTLINLLLGKYNNYSGDIYYNNADLKNISLDSLFEIASFVEQNVFVFDDSIINNITMYSNIDEELLKEAINKSGLAKLIDEKGPDYRCGENGCNLSGGEKQRISIARALVKKSQLLLLDEATSALDNETSSSITNNLLRINNTTKIMITHRLDEEILNQFDEIVVMKNGQIVEFGTYKDLMKNNGTFKSLVELN